MADPNQTATSALEPEQVVDDSELLFDELRQVRADTMAVRESPSQEDPRERQAGFRAVSTPPYPEAAAEQPWGRPQRGPERFAAHSEPAASFRRSAPPVSGAQLVRPGAVLAGRYRVEYLIGRSGRGAVVQVSHLELGHYATLKYLLPEHCVFPQAIAKFLRSSRAASQMHSEHAVRVLDVGRFESGAPYMVSECIRGPSLRDVLRTQGALPISDAVDYVIQACEAVAEAHTLGIVHRALGPASLILAQRTDGSVLIKVRDFCDVEALDLSPHGIDAFATDLQEPNGDLAPQGALGDLLPYMSPEQFRATAAVDARSDVWSLGLVLHELLAGSPAFQAETTAELVTLIAADPAPALTGIRPDVPADLEATVLRCLAKDREQRHLSVAELVAALKPHAPPESQAIADRVVRILSRSTRPAPYLGSRPPQAMVHVGPPASSVSPVAASTPPLAPSGLGGARTVFAAALVSIGGIVGATFGAGFTARSILGQEPPHAAAQAAPVTELPAAPASEPEPAPAVVAEVATVAPAQPATAALPAPTPPTPSAEVLTELTAAAVKQAPAATPQPKVRPKRRNADREEPPPSTSTEREEPPPAAISQKGIDLFDTTQ